MGRDVAGSESLVVWGSEADSRGIVRFGGYGELFQSVVVLQQANAESTGNGAIKHLNFTLYGGGGVGVDPHISCIEFLELRQQHTRQTIGCRSSHKQPTATQLALGKVESITLAGAGDCHHLSSHFRYPDIGGKAQALEVFNIREEFTIGISNQQALGFLHGKLQFQQVGDHKNCLLGIELGLAVDGLLLAGCAVGIIWQGSNQSTGNRGTGIRVGRAGFSADTCGWNFGVNVAQPLEEVDVITLGRWHDAVEVQARCIAHDLLLEGPGRKRNPEVLIPISEFTGSGLGICSQGSCQGRDQGTGLDFSSC